MGTRPLFCFVGGLLDLVMVKFHMLGYLGYLGIIDSKDYVMNVVLQPHRPSADSLAGECSTAMRTISIRETLMHFWHHMRSNVCVGSIFGPPEYSFNPAQLKLFNLKESVLLVLLVLMVWAPMKFNGMRSSDIPSDKQFANDYILPLRWRSRTSYAYTPHPTYRCYTSSYTSPLNVS